MAFECIIPAIPTVQRDDDRLRITRWDFQPGAVTGWHRHAWPYFVILLTDAVMRVHNGQDVAEHRFTAGQTYDRTSGIEHDVMNGGDQPMAFVEIEIKRADAIAFP